MTREINAQILPSNKTFCKEKEMCDYGSKGIVEERAFLPPKEAYPLSFSFRDETIPVEFVRTSTANIIPYVVLKCPFEKATLIFSHGNSTNLGQMMPLLFYYRELLDMTIVGYDYTGYGRSLGGCASEKNAYADITAVMEVLKEKHTTQYEDMILFGKSLGSGPTCYAATRFPVRAIILESAFLSCLDVVFPTYVKHMLNFLNIFPNETYLPDVKCPILIIHGKHDQIVPVSHAKRLVELTKSKTFTYFPNANHNNVILAEPVNYIDVLRLFIFHDSC